MNILALNAGSATLKYKLFRMHSRDTGRTGENVLTEGSIDCAPGDGIIHAAEKAIAECTNLGVDAIGHRLVQGGDRFTEPTRITPAVLEELCQLSDLDPLHNPTEVAMIEAGMRLLPDVPAVAVFDTAFHRTLPETAWRYALPRDVSDRFKLRRYGFHGLSHRYVSGRLLQCLDRRPEGTRLIVCHLGSGSSVCALKDGKSVDTSMGMTPLEGLAMGTRSGDIDPGLLLYLLRSCQMTPQSVDDLLNHRSGLLGLSGRSSDVRDLEQSAATGDASSELALEIFAYRVCKYIGGYAAALGGIDAIAFTGGIGERSSFLRSKICRTLGFLGLHLDAALNEAASGNTTRITAGGAAVETWVIVTDEERQIARETADLMAGFGKMNGDHCADTAFMPGIIA